MRTRSAWLVLTGFLTVGCAAPQFTPVTVGCQTLRMAPVTNPTERLEFHSQGISVLPPQGDRWCIGGSGSKGVTFNTDRLLGERLEAPPSQTEMAHTFALMLLAEQIPKDTKLDTAADLVAFVRHGILGDGTGRFKVVEYQVVPDSSLGAECVRYDAIVEERDNPRVPGAVLVQVIRENYLCLHPYARTPILVLIGASERYIQGTATEPLLIDTLKSECEAFIRSLRFTPPR